MQNIRLKSVYKTNYQQLEQKAYQPFLNPNLIKPVSESSLRPSSYFKINRKLFPYDTKFLIGNYFS